MLRINDLKEKKKKIFWKEESEKRLKSPWENIKLCVSLVFLITFIARSDFVVSSNLTFLWVCHRHSRHVFIVLLSRCYSTAYIILARATTMISRNDVKRVCVGLTNCERLRARCRVLELHQTIWNRQLPSFDRWSMRNVARHTAVQLMSPLCLKLHVRVFFPKATDRSENSLENFRSRHFLISKRVVLRRKKNS